MKDKPPDSLVDFRAAESKKFCTRLQAAGPISNAEFADVIYEATTRWGLSEQGFRDAFGLTAGAVGRWTTLSNLPQPDIRPIIFKWIMEEIKKKG